MTTPELRVERPRQLLRTTGPVSHVRGPSVLRAVLVLAMVAVAIYYGMLARTWIGSETTLLREPVATASLELAAPADNPGILQAYAVGTGAPTAHMAPLRLFILRAAVVWIHRVFPAASLSAPPVQVLRAFQITSMVCQAMTAILAGWIVYIVRRRAAALTRGSTGPLLLAYLAFLLVWFNPALLWNAQVVGRWEIWALPFLMGAALLATNGRWFTAGFVLAIGGLLNGPVLFAAPLFVLCPIFLGKPSLTVRFTAGLALAAGLVVCPWLIRNPHAACWAGSIMLAGVVLYPWPLLRNARVLGRIACVIVATALLIWPWPRPMFATAVWVAVPALVVGLAQMRTRSRAGCGAWMGGFTAAGLFAAGVVFNGNFDWLQACYIAPLKASLPMISGPVNNLPAILSERYGRGAGDLLAVVHLTGHSLAITLKMLLAFACGVGVLISAIGVSIHVRRGDPRAVAGFALPLLLAFVLLPGMPPQFLLWGVILSALLVACGTGATFVHLLLSVVAAAMMAHASLLAHVPAAGTWGEKLLHALQGLHPDLGWVVLLATLFVLHLSIAARPRMVAAATRNGRFVLQKGPVHRDAVTAPEAEGAPLPSTTLVPESATVEVGALVGGVAAPPVTVTAETPANLGDAEFPVREIVLREAQRGGLPFALAVSPKAARTPAQNSIVPAAQASVKPATSDPSTAVSSRWEFGFVDPPKIIDF